MLLAILLFFVLFPHVAAAGDEQQINELLKNGGNVTLENRVYMIDGPIYIHSNTVLTGGPDTIVKVSPSSSQWFQGSIGIISNDEVVDNIEIYGFSIDGNVQNLPTEYHHSRSDTAHDCERCILLHGDSNNFMNDVKIHDMKLYDSFSDGVYIRFCNNAQVYNNFISNTQHEGVFFVSAIDGLIYNNKVAGITSDCLRLDNCVNNKVFGNICFSYNGTHASNTYAGGENGIQIGNSGVSHGYDGRNKPTSTKNIEVFNNNFINNGLQAILLDSVALAPSANVFIHDNTIIGKADLETSGFSFDINNYSYENPPTLQQSEDIFSSILNTELTVSGDIEQKNIQVLNPKWQQDKTTSAYIYLAGYQGKISFGKDSYIPVNASKSARLFTNTKSTQEHVVSQESNTELIDGENNTLIVNLHVKTYYEIPKKNKITILGKSINVTSYETKTESVTFTQTFSAPPVFPTVRAPIVKVTYYNGSHAIVKIPDNPGIAVVNVHIGNSSARQYRLIGEVGTVENGFRSTQYNKVDTYKFTGYQISRSPSGLYIREPFNLSDLKIEVTTPYKKMEVTEYDYVKIEDTSNKILSIPSITLLFVLLTFGRAIVLMIKGKLKCLIEY